MIKHNNGNNDHDNDNDKISSGKPASGSIASAKREKTVFRENPQGACFVLTEVFEHQITKTFPDDQISRDIRMSGKATYWLQWDLGCRLLVRSA